MACVLVQGQFKQRVSFEDAMTGQAFERPLAHMPNKLLLRAGMGERRWEITRDEIETRERGRREAMNVFCVLLVLELSYSQVITCMWRFAPKGFQF